MHIFVSYSRRDSEIVGRIVDRIESSGHEVWIDTDDIVGSDRWRSSVAEAIAAAEVVVLMVSPASMASRSVEREITVAAEEDRRILPVEIQPAEVAIGLQYDLAGVQRITFVDRPFEDGIADLLAAITDAPTRHAARHRAGLRPSTAGTSRPAATDLRASGTGGRRAKVMPWIVVGAAVAVGLALAAGRLRSDDAADVDIESTDPATTTTGPTALTDVALDATVWFAGFTIDATNARFDPADGTVSVDVQFTNDQYDTEDACGLLLDHVALVVDGQRSLLSPDHCPRLTPGTSSRTTLDARVVAMVGGGLDLGDAVVELGGPGQHRAMIPLDGRTATGDFPSNQVVSATLTGEMTSLVVEQVEVVPATCSTWSPPTFPPGRADEVAIVVTGTATSTNPYPLGYGKARLTLPDGTELASSNLNGVIHLLDTGVPERDVRACFVVPTPVAGEYRFTAAADGDEPFPEPIALTLGPWP